MVDIRETKDTKGVEYYTFSLPNGEPHHTPRSAGPEFAANTAAQKYGYGSIDDISSRLGIGGRMNPLGVADEVAAAGQFVGSRLPGSTGRSDMSYSDFLAEQQNMMALYEFARPKSSFAQRLAGGFMLGGPSAQLAGKSANISEGLRQYLINIGLGTVVGGATGAAEAKGGFDMEGLLNRGLGAAEGAVMGGIISGVIPIGTGVAKGLWNRAKRIIKRDPKNTMELNKVMLQLMDRLKDDGVDVDGAIKRMDELGDAGTLADVAGTNVAGMAKGAARQPGPAQNVADELFDARQAGQGDRVYDAARDTMGARADFRGMTDDIINERKQSAAKLYPEAYAQDVPFTAELMGSLEALKPYMSRIWPRAKNIANLERRKLPELVDEDGVVVQVPDMESLDHIKRGLDELLFADKKNMTDKALSATERRLLKEERARLVEELKRLNPKYAEALDKFAGDSRMLEAMEMGRDFLKQESDLMPSVLKGMSEVEKDFFREGVVRKIRDIVYAAPDNVDVVRKIFGSKGLRERMRAVFPDTKSFEDFRKVMMSESRMNRTAKNLMGGSQTAELMAQQGSLKSDLANWGIDLATGNIGGAMTTAARKAANKKILTPDESQAVADVLLTQGAGKNKEMLRKAQELAAQQKLKMLTGDRTLSLTGAAVAPQEVEDPLGGLLY